MCGGDLKERKEDRGWAYKLYSEKMNSLDCLKIWKQSPKRTFEVFKEIIL